MSFISRLLPGNQRSEQDRFAKLLLNRIREAGDANGIVYDAGHFQLRPRSNDGLVLNLANIYDEYRRSVGAARPALIEQIVEAWISVHRRQVPADFADARRNVLPVVRARCYPDMVSLHSKIDGADAPTVPYVELNDELILALVYRMPSAVRVLTNDILAGWNVSLYEATEAARENIEQLPTPAFSSPIAGLYVCEAHDSHDATRILRHDLITSLRIQGEPVVMVPNRDSLLVTGTHNAAALVIMAMLAEHGIDDARHISGAAFCVRGGELVPWLPDPDGELHPKFLRLRLKSIASQYAEQAALLEQYCQQTDEITELAEFDVLEFDERGPFSQCIWKEGFVQLLPKTEWIVFENHAGERVARASWADAALMLRELEQSTGIFPERFRVEQFPPPNTLQLIGEGDK